MSRSRCLAFACLVATSCGTIIHGTTQNIGISSNPSNAKVTIDSQAKGNTPLIADLKRDGDHIVKIELDGYKPFETTLTRNVTGWAWGNILFGGLIGLAVDAISGGLYILTPEQIQGTMIQNEAKAQLMDGNLIFAVVLQSSANWKRVGTLTPLPQS